MSSGKDGREYDGFASFPAGGLGDRTRVHDEFFLNGVRYYTQEQLDAAVAAAQREGANQGYLNGVATNADNSFKAGVKAARDAVADLARPDDVLIYYQGLLDAVAAIDALLEDR